MAIFYFIDLIGPEETIQGGKLFKGENYLREFGVLKFPEQTTIGIKHSRKKEIYKHKDLIKQIGPKLLFSSLFDSLLRLFLENCP